VHRHLVQNEEPQLMNDRYPQVQEASTPHKSDAARQRYHGVAQRERTPAEMAYFRFISYFM
jgi:hypothetical protein